MLPEIMSNPCQNLKLTFRTIIPVRALKSKVYRTTRQDLDIQLKHDIVN